MSKLIKNSFIEAIINKYGKWKSIVFFILILILFFSFGYNDVIIINRHGLSLWDAIFDKKGGLSHFYDVSYWNSLSDFLYGRDCTTMAFYDFTIYIIEGIWLFPLYILSIITKVDVAYAWYGILWGKLLHVCFAFLDGYLVYIITKKQKDEDVAVKSAIYFLTSIITCSSVYIIGQCDSIVIFFMLLGMYYLFEKKKIIGLIMLSIAASMKLFALFFLIAIVLMLEKRIHKIIISVAPSIAFIVFMKLIVRPLETETISYRTTWLANQTKQMFGAVFPFFGSSVPVLIVFVIAIFAFCYLYGEKNIIKVSYYSFILYFLLFISFNITPYWIMYMMPFYCIILAYVEQKNKNVYIFALIGEAALVIGHYIKFYWCYDIEIVNRSIIGRLIGRIDKNRVIYSLSYFQKTDSKLLYGTMYGVFIVCFVIVIIMSYRAIKGKECLQTNYASINQWFYKNNILLRILVAYIPLLIYVLNVILMG